MQPDAAKKGGPCIACMYFGFVALTVMAFFAGAWTEAYIIGERQPEVVIRPAVQPEQAPMATVPPVEAASAPPTQMPADCPLGYSLTERGCRYIGCPAGYQIQNGTCTKLKKQCQFAQFCGGADKNGDGIGDTLMTRDISCKESSTGTSCEYGCAAGSCSASPRGTAEILVRPSSVHSGETVMVSWSTKNMKPSSCKVRALNQDNKDMAAGPVGSFTSSPIKENTPYELSCLELSGSIYTISTTVRIAR